MRRVTFEVVLVGLLAGVVGVHLLLRRLSFLTMSISHASFPGVVIAYWIGVLPFAGSLVFAWMFVVVVWMATHSQHSREPIGEAVGHSSLVGVALAGAMGVGAVLQSIQDRPPRNLSSILTGSVVSVNRGDVIATAVVGAVVAVVLVSLHKELVFSAFDPSGSRAAGYGRWLDLIVQLSVATAIITTVPALGTVLAPSLLIVPAMAARLWTERFIPMMAAAAAVAVGSGIGGLVWSTHQRIAAGPAITLCAGAAFLASVLIAPHGLLVTSPWRSPYRQSDGA